MKQNINRKLSKAEADYILNEPDGEGWELRAPVAGDSVELVQEECRVVIDNFSDTQRVTKDTISGLRWCKRPAVPWTQKDVPALCWLKRKDIVATSLVIAINKTSVRIHSETLSYVKLLKKYEWSADLKTWKSCTKEK